MAGIGALVTYDAEILVQTADVVGAMTLEALEGSAVPFDERLHRVRPHPRQMDCAAFLRALLEGSELLSDPQRPSRVQDAYSLRCMPQVHGAVRDVVAYARWALEIELNSATDNPLIFWEEGEAEPAVLSGGNFHGELIALAMDYLAIGLAELANISERRLNRLLDPAENEGRYPPFLALEPGLHSGFMLVQYTAAALASENKVLAHPASVDTIPSSANTEDHVSMGATAVRHAEMVLRNAQRVVAAELFAAGQAIDLRRRQAGRPLRMGKGTAAAYALLRQHVPFLEADTVMAPWMERACRLVAEGHLLRAAQEGIAGLHAE